MSDLEQLAPERISPPPDTMWTELADITLRKVVLFCLGAGVVFNIGLRGGVDNLGVAIGVLLVIGLLMRSSLRQPHARRLAAVAALPALGLAMRSSPWLVASNAIAIGVLLAAAVTHARSGSVFDTTPLRLLRRLAPALERATSALRLIRPLLPQRSTARVDRAVRMGLAALVAIPLLAVVVALLAAADPVFAGLVLPDLDSGRAAGHVVLSLVLAGAALCVVAAAMGDGDDISVGGRFGRPEITTMLSLAAMVVGLFAVSQLVALTDAGETLVASAGLTPAEYARSGFFQLCWATALLLAFLALVRALSAPGVLAHSAVRLLSGLVPFLALSLVAVSLRRLALYDQAFGLTMLRLWVVGAAVLMGALLIMIALRNLGVGRDRGWVSGGAGALAVAMTLIATVANPEAFVVRHNLGRARAGAELDTAYLGQLSDDAAGAIADGITATRNPAVRAALLLAMRCGHDEHGVAALNLAASRAADARRVVCGS